MAHIGNVRQREFIELLSGKVFYEYENEYEIENNIIEKEHMHYDIKVRKVGVGISALVRGKVNFRIYDCNQIALFLERREYVKLNNRKSFQKLIDVNYISDPELASNIVLNELRLIIDYILTNVNTEEEVETPAPRTSRKSHRRHKLNFELPNVNDYDFSSFDCNGFYDHVQRVFVEKTSEVGISILDKYYNPDVANYFRNSEIENTLKQVFAELMIHSQNRTGMKSIKMIASHDQAFQHSNFNYIKDATYGFDYRSFKSKYEELGDNAISYFTNAMHIGDSKPSINFVKYTKEYADYLSTLGDITREDFINIYSVYNQDINDLYIHFKENVKKGFGIALTCDFFKELSSDVFDIPKPDLWVNRVVSRLTGDSFFEYNINETNLLSANIVKRISTLCGDQSKTAYKLDKMIYLLCTKKLYLDENVRMNSSINDIFSVDTSFHLNKIQQ